MHIRFFSPLVCILLWKKEPNRARETVSSQSRSCTLLASWSGEATAVRVPYASEGWALRCDHCSSRQLLHPSCLYCISLGLLLPSTRTLSADRAVAATSRLSHVQYSTYLYTTDAGCEHRAAGQVASAWVHVASAPVS
jgi:hypothetical protein